MENVYYVSVGTRFLCGPIMLLGSHTKNPSQYDLQRVGQKSLGLVTGRCSGSDFRGIPIEKGVGFEYLNPVASHPMGFGLLGLDPRTIEVFPSYPTAGLFYDLHVLLGCFHPWSPFFWRCDPLPTRFTCFFFYTSLCSLSFVHVQGQPLQD